MIKILEMFINGTRFMAVALGPIIIGFVAAVIVFNTTDYIAVPGAILCLSTGGIMGIKMVKYCKIKGLMGYGNTENSKTDNLPKEEYERVVNGIMYDNSDEEY
jgi:hypothetical protein